MLVHFNFSQCIFNLCLFCFVLGILYHLLNSGKLLKSPLKLVFFWGTLFHFLNQICHNFLELFFILLLMKSIEAVIYLTLHKHEDFIPHAWKKWIRFVFNLPHFFAHIRDRVIDWFGLSRCLLNNLIVLWHLQSHPNRTHFFSFFIAKIRNFRSSFKICDLARQFSKLKGDRDWVFDCN